MIWPANIVNNFILLIVYTKESFMLCWIGKDETEDAFLESEQTFSRGSYQASLR